jgi:hypothetical protein
MNTVFLNEDGGFDPQLDPFEDMRDLIGKRIIGLAVNDDQSRLYFLTDQGTIAYETWAECCSTTWFAEITGVSALLHETVTATAVIPMPQGVQDLEDSRDMSDDFYGIKLRTDKGYVSIVYRNSSNGYYGGTIKLSTDYGVENAEQITADWDA